MNILIADDELNMLKIISAYFEKEGYTVLKATDGEEALDLFYKKKICLAILDWMMPKLNGIQVCKDIKLNSDVKVIMLTSKSEIDDEIIGLESGADEYIKKPFDPRILLIRAKKLMLETNIINIKDLKIDFKKNKVIKNNEILDLTKKEIELLKCFVNNIGVILSRDKILNMVWGMDYFGDYRTVDTHIRRLRIKIGENIITTHRGIGYTLEKSEKIYE